MDKKQDLNNIVIIIIFFLFGNYSIIAQNNPQMDEYRKKQMNEYRKEAKRGSTYCMINYANNLEYNKNAMDSVEANKWYHKAEHKLLKRIEKDNEDFGGWTSWELGEIYYCLKEFPTALHWLQISSSKGNGNASRYLGKMYRDGIGCEVNYKKSVDWFEKATGQGHMYAELELAILYYEEKYSVQDYALAKRHFESLIYDHPYDDVKTIAKAYLGMILYKQVHVKNGRMEKGDYESAFKYLIEASKNKFYFPASAMRVLSACYRYGLGTDIDNEKAEYWLKESANHDDDVAARILNKEVR